MRTFWLLALALALSGCSSWNGQTVTIDMKPDTFSPDPITIEQGTSVCWKNLDRVDRWPASNIHPTHEIYAEFDPKRGIAPGESWCFVFLRPGIWKYHDHLLPELVGTVLVP